MKTIFYTAALALCTIAATQAQESPVTDKVEKTSTVRTTMKTALGNETVTKKTIKTMTSDHKLDPEDAGQTNQSLIATNTKVRTETTYTFDDANFMLKENGNGYTVMQMNEDQTAEVATLTRLNRRDTYLMRSGDEISVSYFDREGNLISEKYDDSNNSITVVKYEVQNTKPMKSEKMRK